MLNELRLVDRIERAHTERPYCECGRQTMTIYRDGAIWLECQIVDEPAENRLVRLWNVVSAPAHVHEQIVEVPAPEALAA
jgi:hypothetical protein